MSTPSAHDRKRIPAAFAMQGGLPGALFVPDVLARLHDRLDIVDESITDFAEADPTRLAGLEVLVTGWGAPTIGARELERMPNLRAVFHAAGTVKGHLSREVWDRGVLVTTAALANAYPVAEYTLAMILLSGKDAFSIAADYRAGILRDPAAGTGNYRRTVGIVSASTVGRLVIGLLASFDLRVLLYDPLIAPDDPVLGIAERVDLADLLRRSSIVSVHAPLLPETRGMIGAAELAMMPVGATLINTARALIVDQDALAAELEDGRIKAVLDVSEPEPLPLDDRLWSVPGVMLTPHIAGALGNELLRLGESVVREVELFSDGLPPAFPVRKHDLSAMA
jgi:phosphoglycerate dehydrogenase-like enzyme